jgi:hypothetical protein
MEDQLETRRVIAAKFFEQAKQKINLLLPKIITGDD